MSSLNLRPPEDCIACASPAKLNLSLKVIGRRADGYHLLESIFCLIDLQDTIYIRLRTDGQIIQHSTYQYIDPKTDLCVRAGYALQEYTHCKLGADIWLDKQIPIGGGLGGGSSNAGTILLSLNQLWQCGLSCQELIQIGLKLGADVPFFIYGKNAFVTGIGEKFQEISVPEEYYVIIKPSVNIPTSQIFSHQDLTRDSKSSIMPSLDSDDTRQNDLQDIAIKLYPEVGQALHILKQYGHAMMSGSGSCVFLYCKTSQEAEKIFTVLKGKYQVFCSTRIDIHPLFNWCSR